MTMNLDRRTLLKVGAAGGATYLFSSAVGRADLEQGPPVDPRGAHPTGSSTGCTFWVAASVAQDAVHEEPAAWSARSPIL